MKMVKENVLFDFKDKLNKAVMPKLEIFVTKI
jgi:hypothetical protein